MLSDADDGAAGTTWSWRIEDVESCFQWCYRVILAMTLLGLLCRGAMKMSSHAGDGVAESYWR
jgi:hypothetical protein